MKAACGMVALSVGNSISSIQKLPPLVASSAGHLTSLLFVVSPFCNLAISFAGSLVLLHSPSSELTMCLSLNWLNYQFSRHLHIKSLPASHPQSTPMWRAII